jgi:hypothetical protein
VEISTFNDTFMDTKGALKNGEIEFNLHNEPIDSHLYFKPSS